MNSDPNAESVRPPTRRRSAIERVTRHVPGWGDLGNLSTSPRTRTVLQLVAITVVAIGLRVWILLQPGLGHANDLGLFTGWMRGLSEHGIAGFYAVEDFCDYPPLMLLALQGIGGLVETLFQEPGPRIFHVGLKSFASLFDLTIGFLLLWEGRRLRGIGAGILAAGLYLFNPVSIYDSAYWGQLDSVYTALLLATFLLVGRGRWFSSGIVAALCLAAKYQSIAILPLAFFEAYRISGTRGLVRLTAGALVAAAVITAPFLLTGTLEEVTRRAYVDVIGQYQEMSSNAYNVWTLFGDPEMPDVAPPQTLLRLAAGGRDVVGVDDSWLLSWSWRRISLVLFALSVAVVMSAYARRPNAIRRYGAAGLLALCFYLFPTEMHERYAYPAIAFLALWAVESRSHERIYWALTIGLLLNLAAVLSAEPLAPQIAAANLLIFLVILCWNAFVPRPDHEPIPSIGHDEEDEAQQPALIRLFRTGTAISVALVTMLAIGLVLYSQATREPSTSVGKTWLAALTPKVAEQGWKSLRLNRAVNGTPIRIGSDFFLQGLGTHAPARLVYEIPGNANTFEAIAGIDYESHGEGSVVIRIELDGTLKYQSPILRAESGGTPLRIDVRGGKQLTIWVDPTGDGSRSDHVDFAGACFTTR